MPAARLLPIVIFALLGCGPGLGSSNSTETTTTTTSSESETSTTSAPTETGTEAESGSLVVFVPNEEYPSSNQCDPWSQDCPDGEKCVPYAAGGGSWDANKCVPIMGDAAPGEPCESGGLVEATDTCNGEGVCWNVTEVEGELVGACHMFCQGTPDDPFCPPGLYCPLSADGSVTLCYPQCDPLAQDCDEGLSCYWSAAEFICMVETANIPPGEPCGFYNDCAGGSICLSAELLPGCAASACCTLFCALDQGDAGCASYPGTSCVPFFDAPGPGDDDNLGLCLL